MDILMLKPIAIALSISGISALLPLSAHALDLKSAVNVETLKTAITQGSSSSKDLDQNTLVNGLKESLAVGAQRAIETVSQSGGYLNDSKIHIPIPGDLQKLADVMNQVSLGSKVRKFEKSMNTAAEVAAPKAATILTEAITSMTFADAKAIYSGGEHAATDYLKKVSESKIKDAFTPAIDDALVQVDATKHYKVFASEASSIPLVRGNVDLDLTNYVTQKAIDGLFVKLAEQEAAIRQNPVAQTTELLQTLWGK
jgi:arginine utilization protein RocB